MRDNNNNKQTVKIELLSQWKLEAEFRNFLDFAKNDYYSITQGPYGDWGLGLLTLKQCLLHISFQTETKT